MLGGRKSICPVKTEWWDTGVVICHMMDVVDQTQRGILASHFSPVQPFKSYGLIDAYQYQPSYV